MKGALPPLPSSEFSRDEDEGRADCSRSAASGSGGASWRPTWPRPVRAHQRTVDGGKVRYRAYLWQPRSENKKYLDDA